MSETDEEAVSCEICLGTGYIPTTEQDKIDILDQELAAERAKVAELEESLWRSRDNYNTLLDDAVEMRKLLAAEKAKVALAASVVEDKLDELIYAVTEDKLVLFSTYNGKPHDPDPAITRIRGEIIATLQSSDALADIRREVARECAEIAQEVIEGIEDAEFACDIYGPVQRAIRAKFGVTE